MRRPYSLLPVLCLGLCAAGNALAIDAIVGECNDCHGENGVSQRNDVPTIAGIDAFSHSEALYAYRDGARPCAESKYCAGDTDRPPTDMCKVSEPLGDDEIEALAEHYAALPFVAAKQDFDAALAAEGKKVHDEMCDQCHSDGGGNPEDEAGILAGQWMGYLKQSFADYKSGEREQPKQMQDKLDALAESDVKALLHYYASQQ